jgi:hypothetical protein
MRSFHYLPPGPEEQRAFFGQLVGTLLGVVVVIVLSFQVSDPALRGVFWGGGAAGLWMLARTAWSLEKKARRAAVASVGVADNGLHLVDDKAQEQIVSWNEISEVGVNGGRLNVTWPGGSFSVGAREMQDGMEMIRAILQKSGHGDTSQDGFRPPTNFIPLDPK